jgi:hypothetical protein
MEWGLWLHEGVHTPGAKEGAEEVGCGAERFPVFMVGPKCPDLKSGPTPRATARAKAKAKYRGLSTPAAKCAASGRDDVCLVLSGGEQTTATATIKARANDISVGWITDLGVVWM